MKLVTVHLESLLFKSLSNFLDKIIKVGPQKIMYWYVYSKEIPLIIRSLEIEIVHIVW